MDFTSLKYISTLIAVAITLPFTPCNAECYKEDIFQSHLKCWASCHLGNCGFVASHPKAFIKCSWQLNSAEMLHAYNFTIRLDFDGDHYSKYVVKCDPENARCDATFNLVNNSGIGEKINVDGKAWLHVIRGREEVCDEIVFFKICMYSKPDPPIIRRFQLDNKTGKLNIITETPECSPSDVKYRLNYTRMRGEHNRSKTVHSLSMRFREATNYIISVESTTDNNIFSEPTREQYVTGPDKAVNGGVKFRCFSGADGKFNLTVFWERVGKIDFFVLNVTDRRTKAEIFTAKIFKETGHQTSYSAKADFLDSNKTHQVHITAYNKGGKSRTKKITFNKKKHCSAPPVIDCHVINKGESWIEVGWKTKADTSYGLEIHRTQVDGQFFSENPKSNTGKWNLTNLQECELYKITIYLTLNGVKLKHCKTMEEFTKGPVPKTSPMFTMKKINARNITIRFPQVTMNDSDACGKITDYLIKYWRENSKTIEELKIGKHKKNVVFTDLKPDTNYYMSVAAISEAGIGKNRKIPFSTEEDAPDDPPEVVTSLETSDGLLVAWNEPRMLNGNVTHYHLFVEHKEQKKFRNLPEEICSEQEKGYLCVYNGSTNSVRMKIKHPKQVSVRACAATGNLCSDWSEASEVKEQDKGNSLILVILCVVCGCTLASVVTVGVIYRCRVQGPQPMKPHMHPDVVSDFEKDLLNENTRKGSRELEKKP